MIDLTEGNGLKSSLGVFLFKVFFSCFNLVFGLVYVCACFLRLVYSFAYVLSMLSC